MRGEINPTREKTESRLPSGNNELSKLSNIEHYVNIIFENKEIFKQHYPQFDDMLKQYRYIARGDPRIGLAEVPAELDSDYVVFFRDIEEAKRLTIDLSKLDYIKELRLRKMVREYKP